MKIVMTLLVRNEEDILEENIIFHLNQGIDYFIATDNLSEDKTKKILKKYEKKGLLDYHYQNKDIHDQGKWVTKMSQLAFSKYQADWIINNDADEFWWPKKHSNLKEAFGSIEGQYNIIECERKNFVFVKNHNSDIKFFNKMIYKEKNSLNTSGHKLPPKQAHRGNKNVRVSDGNHKVTGFNVNSIKKDLIEIFHFPIRTEAQILNKITKGGAALERNTSIAKNIGSTWRKLYSQLKVEGNLDLFINNNIYNESKIIRELKEGLIIEDKRLFNYLNQLKK